MWSLFPLPWEGPLHAFLIIKVTILSYPENKPHVYLSSRPKQWPIRLHEFDLIRRKLKGKSSETTILPTSLGLSHIDNNETYFGVGMHKIGFLMSW